MKNAQESLAFPVFVALDILMGEMGRPGEVWMADRALAGLGGSPSPNPESKTCMGKEEA